MSVSEKKLAVFDALLSGRGVQRIINVAAEVLGNPFVVVDMGLSPIAVSPQLEGDPDWDPSTYEADDRDLRAAVIAGDLKRVYASDETVVGEYPGAQQRYLAARIRRGGNVIGHALVLEREHAFSEEDALILPDICRTLGYELAGRREFDHLSERYGTLLGDVLGGRLTDRAEIESRLERAGVSLPERLNLLVFLPVSDEGQISPRYLRSQLLAAYPGSIGVTESDGVILVVDAECVHEGFEERLSCRVFLDSLHVGVSREFSGLWNADAAYEQASAAARLPGRGGAYPNIVHYDEVAAAHLIECASRTVDERVLAHPAIGVLMKADSLDGGGRLADLEAYLMCRRNAADAARMLHVHKNTMYYRLKKIEELAHVDLSDETTCLALEIALELAI